MSAPTFFENLEHMDAVASQHCEGVKKQHQAENTGLGAWVPFVDEHPQKCLIS